ncbi:MAG: transglutaminase family protein [Candidatus Eremiobacteraeota bacterium]|nr:transglutaminase family protein [Candidatus Eremiobacteraeota bacterium]
MYAPSSDTEEVASLQPLADDSVAWSDVTEATYVLRQRFRYDYPGPIADLHHRLMVVPREHHGTQRRIAARLDVSPHAETHDTFDAFGNPVATFFARRIEHAIEFAHWSVVSRTCGEHRGPPEIAPDHEMRAPTPLTAADAPLRAAARDLRAEYGEELALAEAINAYVHAHMRYVADITTVETTAAEAFAMGEGVCQDYAHIMLSLARRCGLAARYVSGHLVGDGGMHAWVEVVVPGGDGTIVVAFDPTHGRRVDMRYVVVAIGLDYADVAPTSGVFTAPYLGVLTTSKHVGAARVRYAAR